MVMPSSGPISIGQARNECQLSGTINAANDRLSRLAGVGSRSRYAWSWWRGKTYLQPITGKLITVRYGVNRSLVVRYNVANAGFGFTPDGDGRTSAVLEANHKGAIANIHLYSSVVISVGENRNTNSKNGGSWRPTITITRQPGGGNWEFEALFDDNPWGDAAYGTMDFLITANP